MLSKKHFIELANILAQNRVDPALFNIEEEIEYFCRRQNPNFDGERFREWIAKRESQLTPLE